MYTLIDSNSEINEMLKGRPAIIKKLLQLSSLTEEEFIEDEIHTLKFALFNVIGDYMTLTKNPHDKEKINRYLEAHISDLTEVPKHYGELLVKMIKTETFNANRMQKTLDTLQRDLTKYKPK